MECTANVSHTQTFSESLKKLAENPMAQKYVELLIEWVPDDKPKEKPVPKKIEIKPPPKIERPKSASFFIALFQSL
jgi:CRISPR/Cas system endoribonuclease Cas6 (RAMP superfamily)